MIIQEAAPVEHKWVKPNHTHGYIPRTQFGPEESGSGQDKLPFPHQGSSGKTSSSRERMFLTAAMSVLVVVCVWCAEECICFPNGSVAFSCSSMMPVHPPYTPSTSSPPYTLSTSSASYRPGGIITVSLEVDQSNSTVFRGFLLQARTQREQDLLWPIGKFININTSEFTALHCKNMENSTVSQASGEQKKKVQLIWEAPGNSNYREIYFSATLVQDYTKFWVQVKSSKLTLDTSGSSAAGVRDFSSALLCISLLCLSAGWLAY